MRLVVFSLMSLLVSGSSWAADLYVGADAGVTHTRVLTKNLAMRVDLQVVGSGTRHLGAGFMWRL